MSDVVEIVARASVIEYRRQVYDMSDFDEDAMAKAILSAIDAAGWAVVPKKPTDEMLLAVPWNVRQADAAIIYRAMIAAAPKVLP